DLGEWQAGAATLEDLLTQSPEHAEALVERGRLAFHQQRADQAELWLRKAIQLAPHDPQAFYLLHLCLEAEGKHEEDQKTVGQLRQIEADSTRLASLMSQLMRAPQDPAVRTEIGRILLRSGREEEGVQSLRCALQYDPQFAPAHAALADYFQRTGQTQ